MYFPMFNGWKYELESKQRKKKPETGPSQLLLYFAVRLSSFGDLFMVLYAYKLIADCEKCE